MDICAQGTQLSDQQHSQTTSSLVTEFTKSMFSPMKLEEVVEGTSDNISYDYDVYKSDLSSPNQHYSSPPQQMSTSKSNIISLTILSSYIKFTNFLI